MFIVFLLSALGAAIVQAGYEVHSITCVCSTTHCIENQISRCNTTGMCFSQYLDRRDGSHPVVRGCISSKTPLLCENRRPAVAGVSWPVLLCCDSNLCNRDVVPTMPTTTGNSKRSRNETTEIATTNSMTDSPLLAPSLGGKNDSSKDDKSKSSRASIFPKIVSPIYISVLALGVVSLVIVGIVATLVLRRNNKFFLEQYGALERTEEYCKQSINIESAVCHLHSHHHYVYEEKNPPDP